MIDKVLLVVDYQNDFVDGSLGFEAAKTLDSGIAQKIQEYAKDGVVLFTFDTHDEMTYAKSQEGMRLPIPHCFFPKNGWRLYGETGRLYDSLVGEKNIGILTKNTFGCLYLGQELVDLTKDPFSPVSPNCTIEVVGVVTNMCVISNAVICKAALPDARIIINSNLCASNDQELHRKALDVMASMQMDII